jgi:hypothetical protein
VPRDVRCTIQQKIHRSFPKGSGDYAETYGDSWIYAWQEFNTG